MLSITIISGVPNCGVTHNRHYDDRNSFIIQATAYSDDSPTVTRRKSLMRSLPGRNSRGFSGLLCLGCLLNLLNLFNLLNLLSLVDLSGGGLSDAGGSLSSLASGLLGAAVLLAQVGLDGSLWLGLGLGIVESK